MAPLPPKQNGVFKKILKCYDYKQYKMGLKLSKQILGNPETANHGETLAMKGLILNCLCKKEEAYEYVRKGLRNDLTSHVCWHVYGLLLRSDHKYDEAIRCYRNALKFDKDNITILRDLSLLQIQMRDLEGFRDTRYQLFMLRSTQRISWISFAVAYHLLKDYSTAVQILDEFRSAQQELKNNSNEQKKSNVPIEYEQSELLLYQVMIYKEAGNYKEALDFLTKHVSEICDRQAVLEYKAELLIALGRKSAAATLLTEQIIVRNQENQRYYELLEEAMNIKPDDEVSRVEMYETFQQKYPTSLLPFKLPLNFVQDPQRFKNLVDPYLRKFIRRCLPALFRSIRPIYSYEYDKFVIELTSKNKLKLNSSQDGCNGILDCLSKQESIEARQEKKIILQQHGLPQKIKIIEDLVSSYEKNLSEINSFDSDPSTQDSENKTHILWVYYYLGQHYDFVGDYDKALNYVRIAIEHTPTLIELLTLKAKIFKHRCEFEKAAEIMNEPQRLDTADRYLNLKCTKYLLRANRISLAEEMCAKFTRAGISASESMNEMQCMWFHIETAHAYLRLKKFGLALKKCYEIEAYFAEVTEDQFDFHTYCMRKMTLRSYMRLLRMEDVLRSHKFYFLAAETAIIIYLHLYDKPLTEDIDSKNKTKEGNSLSQAEMKKLKNKERKAAAKQQQNQKQQGNNKQNYSEDGKQKVANNNKSNDPSSRNQANDVSGDQNNAAALDPNVLERPKDPLEKAIRFLTPLKTLSTDRIETHILAFEVYKRKNKILLMLQSIKRAFRTDPSHKQLSSQLKAFQMIVDKLRAGNMLNSQVDQVLNIEMKLLG